MSNRKFLVIIIVFFLTACSSATSVPTPTLTSLPTATVTPTPVPTLTPLPTATVTPTSIPPLSLEGLLFFDYNGSGLREGDEPALANLEVCIRTKDSCVTTDENGRYSFKDIAPEETTISLSIVDPNANTPALAFRYINHWKGEVTIPAYEMNSVQVPEQKLNDTALIPIERSIRATVGTNNEIGLMQGFLTLPFLKSQVPEPYIFNYFDIIGYRTFDDKGVHTFFNTQDGIMLNYDDTCHSMFSPTQYVSGQTPRAGVGDSHTGLDYLIATGNFIVSGMPTSEVWYLPHTPDDEYRVDIWFADPLNSHDHYSTDYGHLSIQLVHMGQKIHRGQIIGLSGDSGRYSGGFPQLHFGLEKRISTGWQYIDPFRCTIQFADGLPESFWGSEVSYWTADNAPQYSR